MTDWKERNSIDVLIENMKRESKIFGPLSERTGVDIDKVIFSKDLEERRKLDRAMRKETMIERSRAINTKGDGE